MLIATVTLGWIFGLVLLPVIFALAVIIGILGAGRKGSPGKGALSFAASFVALFLLWFWGSAFTFSGEYHAWNVKEGTVSEVAKRLISDGDKGMRERYVLVVNGQPYGVDDSRAALVKKGDHVSLKCKKDFEWGVPREAHGWACRWNKVPS